MPSTSAYRLPVQGLGPPEAIPSNKGAFWLDGDKMLTVPVNGAEPEFRPFAGWQRVASQKMRNSTDHGTPTYTDEHGYTRAQYQVLSYDASYQYRNGGHGLAIVDTNSNTDGRPVSQGYHPEGQTAARIVGDPVQTTGTGLSDLTTKGNYTGASPAVIAIKITTAASPDQFQYSTDGGATYNGAGIAVTGGWQADVGNGIQIKFAATTGHTANDVWFFSVGGNFMPMRAINRQTPHQYIDIVPGEGASLISTPWDIVYADTGSKVVPAALRPPKIPITVKSDTGSAGTDTDIGDTDQPDATKTWALSSGTNAQSYIKADDINTSATYNAASSTAWGYAAITTPSAGENYIRALIRQEDWVGDKDLAYSNTVSMALTSGTHTRVRFWMYLQRIVGKVPAKTFSLVLDENATLGGTVGTDRYEIPIDFDFETDAQWHLVDLPIDITGTIESVGIRMENALSLGQRHRNSSGTLEPYFIIGLSDIEVVSNAQESATLTGGTKKYFLYTWGDDDNRESFPSPVSAPVQFNGVGSSLDLSGWFPDIQAGLQNAAPEGATKVNVYVADEEGGTDPRLGGFAFYRFTPPEGYPIDALSDEGNDNLILTLSDELTQELLYAENNDRYPFFNSPPVPAEMLCVDGDLIVSAGVPAFSISGLEATFTKDSHLITFVDGGTAATSAYCHLWMEGRLFRKKGEGRVYAIQKVLDTDADGILDALWIGDGEGYSIPYQGDSEDYEFEILGDERSIFWTNRLSSGAIDPRNMSLFHKLEVMPPGEKITGLSKVGESVVVFGQNTVVTLRQNKAALADLPLDSGAAYSNPLVREGVGLAGKRLIDPITDTVSLGLGSRGELLTISEGGSSRHPAGESLAAILQGYGFLSDSDLLKYGQLKYIRPDGDKEYAYLGLIRGSAAATALPGVFIDRDDEGTFTGVAPSGTFGDGGDGGSGDPGWTLLTNSPEWTGLRAEAAWWSDGTYLYRAGGFAVGPSYYGDVWRSANDGVTWTQLNASAFTGRGGCEGIYFGGKHYVIGGTEAGGDIKTIYESSDGGATWSLSGISPIPFDTWRGSSFNGGPVNNKVFQYNGSIYVFGALNSGTTQYHPLFGKYNGSSWSELFDGSGTTHATNPFQYDSDENGRSFNYPVFFELGGNMYAAGYTLSYGYLFLKSTDDGVTWTEPMIDPFGLDGDAGDLVVGACKCNGKVYFAVYRYRVGESPDEYIDIYATENGNAYEQITTTGLSWTNVPQLETNCIMFAHGTKLIIGSFDSSIGEELWSLTTNAGTDGGSGSRSDAYAFTSCIDPGSGYDTAALSQDFDIGLLVDLKTGYVFPAKDCPWTCFERSQRPGCTPQGMSNHTWAADKDGYLCNVFNLKLTSWGCPDTRHCYEVDDVSPGSSTTVSVDSSYYTTAPLPVDADGTGTLDGRYVLKLSSDNSFEVRQISSNTSSTITVSSAWTTNPVAADQIIICPLMALFRAGEIRSDHGAVITGLLMDLQNPVPASGSDNSHVDISTRMNVKLYRDTSGSDAQAEIDSAVLNKNYTTAQIKALRRGIPVTPKNSRGLQLALTFFGGQNGRWAVRDLQVNVRSVP